MNVRDIEASVPSLADYWRALNRHDQEAKARRDRQMKVNAKRQVKCRCKAYPWPHRAGGGLCRHPNPPIEIYQRKRTGRQYRKRYAGLRKRIARANGLHPIRDRAEIDRIMPRVLAQARALKRRYPKMKYKNMTITETGIDGFIQTIGPDM